MDDWMNAPTKAASSSDGPPLTIQRLQEIVASLPPRPEIERIIIGPPHMPSGFAYQWLATRILWLHRTTWDAIPKAESPLSPESARMFGLAVEFYTDEQHGALWRDFMHEVVLMVPTYQPVSAEEIARRLGEEFGV